MERSLIWMESDVNGWACSNCLWRFPVPTLLSGEEAKGAYDRLAAAKFRQHTCEAATGFSATTPGAKRNIDTAFIERARALIKRGYKPKVAVELVLRRRRLNTATIRSSWRRRALMPRTSFKESALASSEICRSFESAL